MNKIVLLLLCTSITAAMDHPQESSWTASRSFAKNKKREEKEKRKQQHTALLALTQTMIEQKKDLNVPIKEGEFASKTILTAAAHHRMFKDILGLAIAAGADPNMPDGNRKTPLHAALHAYCRPTFRYLAKAKATIKGQGLIQEICSPWHDTLNLDQALKRVDMLETMLNCKTLTDADSIHVANEIDEHENTALFHLLWAYLPLASSAVSFENLKKEQKEVFYMQRKTMISHLLDTGLNVYHKNRLGQNAVENINAHPHLKDLVLIAYLEKCVKKTEKPTP